MIKAEEDLGIEDSGPGEDFEIQDNVPNSPLELENSKAASVGDNPLDTRLPDQPEALADEHNTGTKVMSMMEDAIRTKVMSMMEFSENRVMSNKKPGTTLGRARICKECGKEGTYGSVWNHIEAKHLENSYSCNYCGKISKSRNGLAQHRAKDHTK